jgi:hypothetical protein
MGDDRRMQDGTTVEASCRPLRTWRDVEELGRVPLEERELLNLVTGRAGARRAGLAAAAS